MWKKNIATSVHHARVLIRQGHIRVGKRIVNVPSFNVRVTSEASIGFHSNSSLNDGKLGRLKKKKLKSKAKEDDE